MSSQASLRNKQHQFYRVFQEGFEAEVFYEI